MNIKSFTFNTPHSRRSDCFRESSVLYGLVQALDSKMDNTLIHGIESQRVGGNSSDDIMSGKLALHHSCVFLA
ncbi:hypothetical protein TNCV_4893961 [Trichonephila clavipes]|nr:hypothetical protein TNCV_4893961 [Trichonephila clavipes]